MRIELRAARRRKREYKVLTKMRQSIPLKYIKRRKESLFDKQIKSSEKQINRLRYMLKRSLAKGENTNSPPTPKKGDILPTRNYGPHSQTVKTKANAAYEILGNPSLSSALFKSVPPIVSNSLVRKGEKWFDDRVPMVESNRLFFTYKYKDYELTSHKNEVKVEVLELVKVDNLFVEKSEFAYFTKNDSMVYTEVEPARLHVILRLFHFLVDSAHLQAIWNTPHSTEPPQVKTLTVKTRSMRRSEAMHKLMQDVKDKIPVGVVLHSRDFYLFSAASFLKVTDYLGNVLVSLEYGETFLGPKFSPYWRRIVYDLNQILKGRFTVGPYFTYWPISPDAPVLIIPGDLPASPWPHGFRAMKRYSNRLVDVQDNNLQ